VVQCDVQSFFALQYKQTMSFSRLPYDDCAYTHKLSESVSGNQYMINPLFANHCDACYVPSSTVRLQKRGPRTREDDGEIVDVNSELLGLTRKSSQCPSQKYIPGASNHRPKTHALRECNALDPEPSRLSNPPCTLKGKAINRWQYLCHNPQDKIETPFPTDVSTRMLAKDNHRPCYGRPTQKMMSKYKQGDMERCGPNAPANPDSCHKNQKQPVLKPHQQPFRGIA
jgi:hypothetical protein